jgi:hypothetical protein
MTMISAICIVDFDVEEFDTAAIAKLLEAISHAESVPRINLGASTPIPLKAGWPGPLVRGDVASVASWLDASDGQPGWWCATIDVTGLHAPAVYVDLVERLFDCGVNPWVRSRPPHGDSAVVEIQKRTTALAGVDDGTNAPPWPSLPCVRVRGGGIVDGGSGRAIWDVPRDELLRELGQASAERALFTLSGPFSVTLPDGSKLRQFLGGGSMAVGHTIAQIVGSASLGFHDTEELGAWLSDVGGEPTEPSFSTFAWQYADRPLDPDGRLTVRVPQRRSFADAVRLASSIVRGEESETEELVGLRVHLAGQTCLDKPIFLHELTAIELAAARESVTRDAMDLLVTACGLIAASRVPKDKRVAAARTLAYLGPPRADTVIASLRKADRDVHKEAERAWRRGAARSRRERVERAPDAALKNLRDQVARLVRACRGEGGHS